MGRTVAITIQKGGEGKTTATLNVAAIIAKEFGRRVLIIDLDASANATFGLVKGAGFDFSILDVITGRRAFDASVVATPVENLFLLPSCSSLNGFTRELSADVSIEYRLKDALDDAKAGKDFDYIFLDTPPTMDMPMINALVAAGHIVVPTRCTSYSVKGLVDLVALVQNKIRRRLNPEIQFAGAFLNGYRDWISLDKEIAKSIATFFTGHGLRLFETRVREAIRVREAATAKKPLITFDAAADVTGDFLSLTHEIVEVLEGRLPTESTAPSGVLSQAALS